MLYHIERFLWELGVRSDGPFNGRNLTLLGLFFVVCVVAVISSRPRRS